MQLTIKTLDQKTFRVEFDESKTVWELKSHLWQVSGIGVKPELQQLIYAGRVLDNEDDLKSYSIDERKFLVIMTKKPPSAEKIDSASEEEAKKAAEPPPKSKDKPEASSKARVPEAKEQPVEPTATPTAVFASEAASPHTTSTEDLVANIISMGYGEADVRRALAASFNNPDRAIQYLIEGIPELPQAASSELDDSNPLSFLRNDPRYLELRRIIQRRPELLAPILQRIGQTNPALLHVLQGNQEEFFRTLNESDSETDVTGPDYPLSTAIVLTEADRQAIERLTALGFSEDNVVQAYLACDKDEEQTADFLCRQMDDDA